MPEHRQHGGVEALRGGPVGAPGSSRGRTLPGNYPSVDNALIADRLDAFASLLELSDANPYTVRAYRRAAETIRGAAVAGRRSRALRAGARPARDRARGSRRGCASWSRRARSPSWRSWSASWRRTWWGSGRYLGLTARSGRSRSPARSTSGPAEELREAAAAGRLALGARRRAEDGGETAGRAGPRGRAAAAARAAAEPRPRARGRDRRQRSGGEPAGDVRRFRDSCEYLAVVVRSRRARRRCSSASPRCRRSSP